MRVALSRLGAPGLLVSLIVAVSASAYAAGEGGEHAHEEGFKHDLALFVGVTDDRGEEAFTLGTEYGYRVVSWFDVGGLIDVSFGDERATLIAAATYFRPTRRLILILAPGVERFEKSAQREGRTEFALRIGVAWEFEITERFYLAPALKLDFVDNEEIWVGGVNFGFKLGAPS